MKIKLSGRIGAFVGGITLFVALSIGLISIIYSSNALIDSQKQSIMTISDEGAKRVQTVLKMRLDVLYEVGQKKSMNSMYWDIQRQMLTSAVDRLGYLDIGVVSLDGKARYVISGESTDLSDREYIQKVLKGESNVSNVLISKVTNSPVIMYAVPIMENDKVVGALIGRKDGASLNDITDELGVGERGYAFIVGADSTIYSHPNRDLVLAQTKLYDQINKDSELNDLGSALKNLGTEKAGVINYKYNGDKHMTAMAPIPGTNWTLGVGNYENDMLAPMFHLRNIILIVTIIVFAIGVIAGSAAGLHIAKPIKLLLKTVEKMSNYDFTPDTSKKDLNILKRKDEIGTIGNAIVSMKENIILLVQSVAQNSEQVAASSEELTSTTQQSVTAANEVARTIEEISKGASDQAKETELGADRVQNLSELISKEQQYLIELNNSINEVNELKDKGLDAMKDLRQKSQESSEAATNIRRVIMETDKSAEKIESASNMIKSIAGQTNLLALNAAIEAARAGDAGRGFAVVADEIRELAEQSNRFTNEIDIVIKDLSNKIESSVETIEVVSTIMESQTNSVNNTNEKFNGINNAIEKMKEVVNGLNDASSIMEQEKEEIVANIENLSAIAEENAAGTEEAAASVEEQTASMDEIANASESLAQLAQELQTEIGKFKY